MSLNNVLRKISVLLERHQAALFTYNVNEQKKYIKKLGVPKDEIQRSYFQYKCQMKFNGKWITMLLNIVSFPVALIYLLKYGRNQHIKNRERRDAVFFCDGKPENILPQSLKEEFQKIETTLIERMRLDKWDKAFIRAIIMRYPFSWQFILKCIIKIGRYSYSIAMYHPRAIIVCAEYSFTSSILTMYCRKKGIKHIDVMHGEKMYYMRDSFFEFDRCYIWDSYYAKLLSCMMAEKKQFIVEVPDSMKFIQKISRSDRFDYTYYLAAENEQVLKKIADVLYQLHERGYRISVRPHPRYSNMKIVNERFSFAYIENVKDITIEMSLMQTKYAISLYSTVLNQAISNFIPIVIDDISNPENFKKLKELGYICLNKEHQVLSEVIQGDEA
ncbi:MAG: hypothetical protein KH355_02750 [Clostridiales bacterium]|nr:hypothetical protein [Clostridiales bacterium]